jgi:hypothetical protein
MTREENKSFTTRALQCTIQSPEQKGTMGEDVSAKAPTNQLSQKSSVGATDQTQEWIFPGFAHLANLDWFSNHSLPCRAFFKVSMPPSTELAFV